MAIGVNDSGVYWSLDYSSYYGQPTHSGAHTSTSVFERLRFPKTRNTRGEKYPRTRYLGFWVIHIVQVLGKYMIVRYLDS